MEEKEELLQDIKEILQYIYHSDEKYYDAVDFSKDQDFMKIYHKYMESEEERIVREEKERQYLLDLEDDKIKLEYEIECLEIEMDRLEKEYKANTIYVERLKSSIWKNRDDLETKKRNLRKVEYDIDYEKEKTKKEIEKSE